MMYKYQDRLFAHYLDGILFFFRDLRTSLK